MGRFEPRSATRGFHVGDRRVNSFLAIILASSRLKTPRPMVKRPKTGKAHHFGFLPVTHPHIFHGLAKVTINSSTVGSYHPRTDCQQLLKKNLHVRGQVIGADAGNHGAFWTMGKTWRSPISLTMALASPNGMLPGDGRKAVHAVEAGVVDDDQIRPAPTGEFRRKADSSPAATMGIFFFISAWSSFRTPFRPY